MLRLRISIILNLPVLKGLTTSPKVVFTSEIVESSLKIYIILPMFYSKICNN